MGDFLGLPDFYHTYLSTVVPPTFHSTTLDGPAGCVSTATGWAFGKVDENLRPDIIMFLFH